MKYSTLYFASMVSMLVLTGCNDNDSSDTTTVSNGVYSGVTQDERGAPVEATVILESPQSAILTLSDDRDHLSSYSGRQTTDGKITFAPAKLSCEVSSSTLECYSDNGDFELNSIELSQYSLTDFAGSYQAMWGGSLYKLMVDSQGGLSLEGEQCTSTGILSISKEVDNLVEFDLTNDDCGLDVLHGYSFLTVENDNLYSMDVVTGEESFPISWVRVSQ